MRRIAKLHLVLAAALTLPLAARAADEIFVTDTGAIGGYDPVAYHTQDKPVPGSANITYVWNGATWRFASEANRDLFVANPERYAPQYGGYCALGTAYGHKASTVPEAFAVVDGKLYLNHDAGVQAKWDENRSGFIAEADGKWKAVEHAPYTPEE